jgi:hypothetical protein
MVKYLVTKVIEFTGEDYKKPAIVCANEFLERFAIEKKQGEEILNVSYYPPKQGIPVIVAVVFKVFVEHEEKKQAKTT